MKIDILTSKIKSLPTLPVVINKIIKLVENPKTSASEIASVISHDPGLAAKILSVVNSAYYGFPRKISTISHAIMILGFNDIKNIALSISVFDVFKGKQREGLNIEEFWKHSIGVGVCSRQLGKRVKYPEAEEAFIAGLLHDIGKIAFQKYMTDEYARIVKLAQENDLWITDCEKKVLDGLDHTVVGEIIAEKWKLPTKLTKVIASHHNPIDTNGGIDMLTALVHAGDVFARIRKIGNGGDNGFIPSLKKEIWYKLEISSSELEKIYVEMDEEMAKTEEFLGLAK